MKKLLLKSLLAVVIVAPTFASASQSCSSTSSKNESSKPLSNLRDRQKELEEFRLQMILEAEQKRKSRQQAIDQQIRDDALIAHQIAQDEQKRKQTQQAIDIAKQKARAAIILEEKLLINDDSLMLSDNSTIRFEQILRIKEDAQKAREQNL